MRATSQSPCLHETLATAAITSKTSRACFVPLSRSYPHLADHKNKGEMNHGLVIDKNITFADLKGTLEVFAKELFGPEPRPNSDLIISHLQSQVQRLMFPASSAAEKDAVSVKDPVGLKSLAAEQSGVSNEWQKTF